MKTGAVIAAAGMSSRMGAFKPLLRIGGLSIAQRVVATFRQVGVHPIAVVTGHKAESLKRHLANSGAVFVHNEGYRTTQMFDSAMLGLSHLAEGCDRVFFTPVDIPLFTADTLSRLLDSKAELACPVFRGQRGHPILLSRAVIARLSLDSGENGLSGALSRCGIPMTAVSVEDPGVLRDADTPEEYRALLQYHESQS